MGDIVETSLENTIYHTNHIKEFGGKKILRFFIALGE